MKTFLVCITVAFAPLAETTLFADCGKYTKAPTGPEVFESDLTPASWTCVCSTPTALSQSKKVSQRYTVNCGNCSQVPSGYSNPCKYTDPATNTQRDCPNDDCVQGSTYIGSSVFKTRSIQCGSVTYNIGIGASYDPAYTTQVNAAKAGVLKKLGLIGGSITLSINGSVKADANGNVSFCFLYTGDWN